MLLRAAIVVLLVLNIGVAAWWLSGAKTAPERPSTPIGSGVPRLRLVGEAGPQPAFAAPAATPVAAATEVEPPAGARPAQAVCLRFGPFADATARDAVRPMVTAASSEVMPRDIPAMPARGWKVHIPPFASREEAQAMGERIKAAGITDWYLLNEGAQANGIALGRYGGEAAARRREAELKAKGIPAQAAPLGEGTLQWWLDARLAPEADLAALVGVGPSRRIDCASLR